MQTRVISLMTNTGFDLIVQNLQSLIISLLMRKDMGPGFWDSDGRRYANFECD
jgi:hypothetical protein